MPLIEMRSSLLFNSLQLSVYLGKVLDLGVHTSLLYKAWLVKLCHYLNFAICISEYFLW